MYKVGSSVVTVLVNHEKSGTWLEVCRELDGRWNRGEDTPTDIINVPEEHKLEGFMVALSTGGLMYIRHKNNMPPPHVIKAIIDLSKHNITYKHGEGAGR